MSQSPTNQEELQRREEALTQSLNHTNFDTVEAHMDALKAAVPQYLGLIEETLHTLPGVLAD